MLHHRAMRAGALNEVTVKYPERPRLQEQLEDDVADKGAGLPKHVQRRFRGRALIDLAHDRTFNRIVEQYAPQAATVVRRPRSRDRRPRTPRRTSSSSATSGADPNSSGDPEPAARVCAPEWCDHAVYGAAQKRFCDNERCKQSRAGVGLEKPCCSSLFRLVCVRPYRGTNLSVAYRALPVRRESCGDPRAPHRVATGPRHAIDSVTEPRRRLVRPPMEAKGADAHACVRFGRHRRARLGSSRAVDARRRPGGGRHPHRHALHRAGGVGPGHPDQRHVRRRWARQHSSSRRIAADRRTATPGCSFRRRPPALRTRSRSLSSESCTTRARSPAAAIPARA